jgi:hypothetical protein
VNLCEPQQKKVKIIKMADLLSKIDQLEKLDYLKAAALTFNF